FGQVRRRPVRSESLLSKMVLVPEEERAGTILPGRHAVQLAVPGVGFQLSGIELLSGCDLALRHAQVERLDQSAACGLDQAAPAERYPVRRGAGSNSGDELVQAVAVGSRFDGHFRHLRVKGIVDLVLAPVGPPMEPELDRGRTGERGAALRRARGTAGAAGSSREWCREQRCAASTDEETSPAVS